MPFCRLVLSAIAITLLVTIAHPSERSDHWEENTNPDSKPVQQKDDGAHDDEFVSSTQSKIGDVLGRWLGRRRPSGGSSAKSKPCCSEAKLIETGSPDHQKYYQLAQDLGLDVGNDHVVTQSSFAALLEKAQGEGFSLSSGADRRLLGSRCKKC